MCICMYVVGLDVLWCLVYLFNRSHGYSHGISLAVLDSVEVVGVLLYNYTRIARSSVETSGVRNTNVLPLRLFSISTEINTSDLSPNRE